MALALDLGRRVLGAAWPNPAVGCVIVSNGEIIGQAHTAPGGRPHAETQALAQAGARAKGATAYVTLEPCSHHGRTAPCAEALIELGISRVVCALQDVDPRVSGRGFAMLRAAGIEVETGVMADRAAEDLASFFHKVTTGRPRITLKLAMSLDGRIATASGHSKWITGELARDEVHAMRAEHDAIMVGAGTARADDPQLTVRGRGVLRQPVRVIVSRRLDVPLTGQLARTAKDPPVWMCHGAQADRALTEAWGDLGARLFQCDHVGRHLDLRAVLGALGEAGLTRVLCEGGGALAASLLAADLVDDLVIFTAGCVIGAEGLPGISAMGLARLEEAPRFRLVRLREVGGDIVHHWARRDLDKPL